MSTRSRRVLAAALAALTLAIAFGAVNSIYGGNASAKAPPRTTTVQLGMVQATVTATGNLAPAAALSVNFSAGGVVTEVDVKAGDQVKAGQTMAKIDDSVTKAALASAQAALASAQAGLASAQQPITPALAAQNAAAAASAQQQVAAAQSSLNGAMQTAAVSGTGYQNAVNQVQAQMSRDSTQYLGDQAACSTATTSGTGPGGGASCATMLAQDQSAMAKDNDALVNANQQQAAGQLKDQLAIVQARNSLAAAQDSLASTVAANNVKAAATPTGVAAGQSQVAQARANLVTAEKNEANAALTAPSDGTVAAVNGVVGQTVSGGGTAASPSSTASSATAGGASTAGGSPSASSQSSAFVTLDSVSALQVVAGFAEADASRVQLGQAAAISINALPNQPLTGQVSRIDVNSTVVSNVVTYNVVANLQAPPPALKPGMTANVNVVVSARDNVLHVPTADVTTRGGISTVVVVRNGRQIPQVVTTGLVGDQSSEITSGLSEGDTIVEPTVAITPSSSGTGPAGTARVGGGLGGGGGILNGGGG